MEYIILALCIIISLLLITILFILLKNNKNDNKISDEELNKIKQSINESMTNLSNLVSENIALRNEKLIKNIEAKVDELKKEEDDLKASFDTFRKEMTNSLNDYKFKNDKDFSSFVEKYTKDSSKQKEEIMDKLSFEIKEFNKNVKNTLDEFKNDTKDSIKELKDTLNKNLTDIREDNNKKLEKINDSVNEKLQKTLEEKLKDSFKSVVEGIGGVNKAIGEIKGLASDVGSLKNVLTNVKTKGIMGEVILGNIIREFLTSGQFLENVATKKNSNERVEFAIKLPGAKDEEVLLPVDSKFPYEAYSKIHESEDVAEIKKARDLLRSNLLKYAKDVHDKYIDAPNTTDFAVIFLPIEGLYLEALNMGLFEEIQSKYKVNLTGPTTFTAFINSLNMGFKSLMIQKKSADVFNLLAAVKTEFSKFAEALEKTQNKVNAAADELDKLVGTRTKMMNSKLKSIDAIDDEMAKEILEIKD